MDGLSKSLASQGGIRAISGFLLIPGAGQFRLIMADGWLPSDVADACEGRERC